MQVITKKFYLELGASEEDLLAINKELALPVGLEAKSVCEASTCRNVKRSN